LPTTATCLTVLSARLKRSNKSPKANGNRLLKTCFSLSVEESILGTTVILTSSKRLQQSSNLNRRYVTALYQCSRRVWAFTQTPLSLDTQMSSSSCDISNSQLITVKSNQILPFSSTQYSLPKPKTTFLYSFPFKPMNLSLSTLFSFR